MRKFKFLLPLLTIPLLGIFSCGGNNTDPYKDKIVKLGDAIVTTGSIKNEYQAGEKIQFSNDFAVYYPAGTKLNYLDETKSELVVNEFFITLSDSAPTQNRFISTTVFNTNKQSETRNIYIAFLNSEDKICISNGISVTVKNSSVINPVLYYVGGGVLIVLIVLIVFFARKYKQTH